MELTVVEGAPSSSCGSGIFNAETQMWDRCVEPVAYAYERVTGMGHGLACAGHALRLRTDGLVRRMWTCSPSMV